MAGAAVAAGIGADDAGDASSDGTFRLHAAATSAASSNASGSARRRGVGQEETMAMEWVSLRMAAHHSRSGRCLSISRPGAAMTRARPQTILRGRGALGRVFRYPAGQEATVIKAPRCPTPARTGATLALIFAIGCIALACSGEKTVICPAGYHAEGMFCYPDASGGTTPTDTATATDTGATDSAVADTNQVEDTAVADSGEPDTTQPDTAQPDTSQADTATTDTKDVSTSKNPIGAACTDGLDCKAGLECFSWPGGYCTQPGCSIGGSPCPGSATCWGADAKSQLCTAGCEVNSDCRLDDGYACKRLTQAWGGVDTQLCLPGGTSKPGTLCKGPLDCSGESTCVTDIPGGYCARVGCGKGDSCETGTACVLRDGKPLCLKVCTGDVDCQVGGGLPRKCALRTDLSKVEVKVCLDTDKAAPVGGDCLADLDCQSGKCQIVAKGTCQVGGLPCLVDAQCGANGPCEISKDKEKGVCSQPCGKDAGCPIGALCVPGSDQLSGSCAPTCKGPGDSDTCKTPGTECVYGVPIATPGGTASPGYACALRPAGSAGANCIATSECTTGSCFTNAAKTAGYCQGTCGPGKPICPFGSECIDSGIALCERLCSVDYDCPVQMICGTGTPTKTCTLP